PTFWRVPCRGLRTRRKKWPGWFTRSFSIKKRRRLTEAKILHRHCFVRSACGGDRRRARARQRRRVDIFAERRYGGNTFRHTASARSAGGGNRSEPCGGRSGSSGIAAKSAGGTVSAWRFERSRARNND